MASSVGIEEEELPDEEVLAREDMLGSSDELAAHLPRALESVTTPLTARQRKSQGGNQPHLTGAAAAAVGAFLLFGALGTYAWRKLRRRHKAEPVSTADYSGLINNALPAQQDNSALAGQPLTAVKLIISPLLSFEGQCLPHSTEPATSTAPALQSLLDAGISVVGTSSTEELFLGLQAQEGATTNPAVPDSIASGTGAGIATAVAAGLADCGLGVDHIAGLKVHASTSGLYGYRCTPGAISGADVMPVAGSLDALGLVARDPDTLVRVGRALDLPGGAFHKSKLLRLVVAEDLFAQCDSSVQEAKRAFVFGGHRWPGNDYIQPGNFVRWLHQHVPTAQKLLGTEFEDGSMAVLEAIRHAAVALAYREFAAHHGETLGQHDDLPEALDKQLDNCMEVAESGSILEAAAAVQQELAAAMRDVLKDGVVFVLPALPAVPPSQSGNVEEWNAFEAVAMQFGAIAALAGIPQVNVPVHLPGQGPLSIAMLGLAKSDMSLLNIAARLAPLIAQAVPTLNQAGEDEQQPSKSARSASNAAASTSNGVPAADEAEKSKVAGNEAFKAQQFQSAVRHYSSAVEHDPSNSVYYSNRAMAFLKLLQFENAERDCTQALKIKPAEVKTLLRRGTARAAQGNAVGAMQDYRHVLSLEQNNRQARAELKQLQKTMDAMEPQQNGHAEPLTDESHLYA